MKNLSRYARIAAILVAGLAGFQACSKDDASKTDRSKSDAKSAPEQRVVGVIVREIQPGPLQLKISATGVIRSKHQVPISADMVGKVVERTRGLGDFVAEGETILQLDPEPYELAAQQAAAAFAAAQVAYDRALRDLERSRRLRENGDISQFELENSELGERNAAANLEMADAARKLADRNLRLTRVASPISGTIVQIDAQIGQTLQPGMPIGIVVALDQLEIEVGLSEREIARVRCGNQVHIYSEAYPGEAFSGEVKSVGAAGLDPGKTFPVVITLNHTSGGLKPGMAVSLEIVYAEYTQVLRVPRIALVQGEDQPTLFVVEGEIARSRRIVLGPGDERTALVETGLNPGDLLVVEGQNFLQDSTPVKILFTQVDTE